MSFLEIEINSSTIFSSPGIIDGFGALIILELMKFPNSFRINLTVLSGVRNTFPFSTCLLINIH